MPRQKRFKTKYPGVYYVDVVKSSGKEKVYYIFYRRNGTQIEEKAGCQYADDMTEAKAAGIRADRMRGRELSNNEKRASKKAEAEAAEGRYTLSRLWKEYSSQRPDTAAAKVDGYRFKLYLEAKFGGKEPHELHQLDVDRLRINLLKKKSPQTVKHVLGLIKRLSNFGVKKQLCEGVNFKIEMPRVDNLRTEDLNPDQLKNLLKAMDESTDTEAADFMRLALFTGMRRGELMKLRWKDIDFTRGFIHITHDPKCGKSQMIPLNEQARAVLDNHPKLAEHVFIRANKEPFTNVINKRVREIRKTAGLPSSFRPLHGLRHAYASMLASSGQVDLYTLQKLLTHKSPIMTQRYAHLRDESLRKASTLAGNLIIEQAATPKAEEAGKEAIGA